MVMHEGRMQGAVLIGDTDLGDHSAQRRTYDFTGGGVVGLVVQEGLMQGVDLDNHGPRCKHIIYFKS